MTNKLNIIALNDGSTSLGYNNTTSSQCTTIGANASSLPGQMNSVCIGFSSKNYGSGAVSVGSYATSYNNCCAYGYNSGVQSSSSNQNNSYFGNNANVPYSTNYSNSCAIGYNSVINSSNTIQLGRDLLDTTNCYALTTTNLTGTNITGTNITTTYFCVMNKGKVLYDIIVKLVLLVLVVKFVVVILVPVIFVPVKLVVVRA